MPIWVQNGSGWQQVTNPFYNLAGVWKTVINAWVNVAGTWQRIFGAPLMVSVSASTVYGVYTGLSLPQTVTSSSSTCMVAGATGSVTYSWVEVSGDIGTSANSPTAATTTWSKTSSAYGDFVSTWVCNVVDSAGNMGQSPPVTVHALFVNA